MDIGTYPMSLYPKGDTKKCGLGILIVNQHFKDPNQNRDGAEGDVISFGKLMGEEFSLELYTYKDMTLLKTIKLLRYVSGKRGKKSSKYPRLEARHSVLVIALSSHGAREGIYTSDMKLLKFHKIRSFFNPKKCPIFTWKPKILFLNCCRRLEDGVERKERAFPVTGKHEVEIDGIDEHQSEEEMERVEVASEGSDFLSVNFCVRGMDSLRHRETGSLVANEFYKFYRSHGHGHDFQRVMTGFTRHVKPIIFETMGADKDNPITQCPEVTTTLDRLLFFPEKELIPIKNLHIFNPDSITENSNAWEVHTMPEEENLPETVVRRELSYSLSIEELSASTAREANEVEKVESCETFEDGPKKSRIKGFRFHPYHSTSHRATGSSSLNSVSANRSGRRDGTKSIV